MERFPVASDTLVLRSMPADHKLVTLRASVSTNIHVKRLAGVNNERRRILLREGEGGWGTWCHRSPRQVQVGAEKECRQLVNLHTHSHATHDCDNFQETWGTPL